MLIDKQKTDKKYHVGTYYYIVRTNIIGIRIFTKNNFMNNNNNFI